MGKTVTHLDQEVQLLRYRINKSWSVMYSVVTIVSVNNTVLPFEVAKRVDLKSSHCKNKTFVTMCDNG